MKFAFRKFKSFRKFTGFCGIIMLAVLAVVPMTATAEMASTTWAVGRSKSIWAAISATDGYVPFTFTDTTDSSTIKLQTSSVPIKSVVQKDDVLTPDSNGWNTFSQPDYNSSDTYIALVSGNGKLIKSTMLYSDLNPGSGGGSGGLSISGGLNNIVAIGPSTTSITDTKFPYYNLLTLPDTWSDGNNNSEGAIVMVDSIGKWPSTNFNRVSLRWSSSSNSNADIYKFGTLSTGDCLKVDKSNYTWTISTIPCGGGSTISGTALTIPMYNPSGTGLMDFTLSTNVVQRLSTTPTSVIGNVPIYNTTTGNVIKDSGIPSAEVVRTGASNEPVSPNPTVQTIYRNTTFNSNTIVLVPTPPLPSVQ